MFTLCALLTSFLSSCSNGENLPNPEEKVSGCTVIVYMGADNDISTYSEEDLQEILMSSSEIPSDCQVVVFQDVKNSDSKGDEIPSRIIHITSNGHSVWKEYSTNLNSASPSTVRNVLSTIVKFFPSEKFSLVMWSHGSGWIDAASSRAIIRDDAGGRSNWLNISNLADVLKGMPFFEYILFDACWMQTVEVAAELYPYASYLIASPAEIPNKGAPYDIILKALCEADIVGIINGYASGYSNSSLGVVFSAVDTKEFPRFCQASAAVIARCFPSKEKMPSTSGIQIYAPSALEYYSSGIPVPYDIRSAFHHYLDDSSLEAWETQWKKTILFPTASAKWDTSYGRYGTTHCTLTDSEHFGGISMFIPNVKYENSSKYQSNWNSMFQTTSWYDLAHWEKTGW